MPSPEGQAVPSPEGLCQVQKGRLCQAQKGRLCQAQKGRLCQVPEGQPTADPEGKATAPKATTQKKKKKKPKGKLKLVLRDSPAESAVDTMPEITIDGEPLESWMAPKPSRSSQKGDRVFYLENQEMFASFMVSFLNRYRPSAKTAKMSCDSARGGSFEALAHQKLVSEYLSLQTPYRGLVLVHGLGSGKTCSSIVVAEGLKTRNRVLVMTPAALRGNYLKELKSCGDAWFRRNQHWRQVPPSKISNVSALSRLMGLNPAAMRKRKGVWVADVRKPPNYDTLSAADQRSLEKQLDEMIAHKYDFVNYNGLRQEHLDRMTEDGAVNPFDDKVVVIDEAHNVVGRIVNKLGRPKSLAMRLYELLLTAQRCRLVFLTGTPLINYPNELGVMFNILRGYIKTWTFKLQVSAERRVDQAYVKGIFDEAGGVGLLVDYVSYKPSTMTLTLTRVPPGFARNKGGGVVATHEDVPDEAFERGVTEILFSKSLKVDGRNTKVTLDKALPDTKAEFNDYFIDGDMVKNKSVLQRRIQGLASFFRSAQESLLPAYDPATDFHVVELPMSRFQFGVYEEARASERKLEARNALKQKRAAQGGVFEETVSTYRIFSRAFCNYVFPRPDIRRPMPRNEDDAEAVDLVDAAAEEDMALAVGEPKPGSKDAATYEAKQKAALGQLERDAAKYLTPEALETYSPKFLAVLERLQNPSNEGVHMLYSQFRTLEGIGVLKLVLEANGFAQFRVAPKGKDWKIVGAKKDKDKPKFALYTGTETPEEKEIIRNIFNGTWDELPPGISREVKKLGQGNERGQLIKLLMLTAAGAEGVDLKNVRFVHLLEPYWHPVRIRQVVGRAVRICSHHALPPSLRNVTAFLYVMRFSDEQLEGEDAIELRLKDVSKLPPEPGASPVPLTSDQALLEIATMKEEVISQLTDAIRGASIDCAIHPGATVRCLSYGAPEPGAFAYVPSLSQEEADHDAAQNKVTAKLEGVVKAGFPGPDGDVVMYALHPSTGDVYDLREYEAGRPVKIGVYKSKPRKDGGVDHVLERL